MLGVAQVGTALRVLTADTTESGDRKPTDIAQRMQAALAAAGQKAEVATTPLNLEDVFVAVTRNGHAKQERAA